MEKLVLIDNGTVRVQADTPTESLSPSEITPQFKCIVTNNSPVTLTNVVVSDEVHGIIGMLPTLAPGESFQWIVIG